MGRKLGASPRGGGGVERTLFFGGTDTQSRPPGDGGSDWKRVDGGFDLIDADLNGARF